MNERVQKFKDLVVEMTKEIVETDKKNRSEGSINFLLDIPSSQSVLIRFGNKFEGILREYSEFCGMPHHELSGKVIKSIQIDYLIGIKKSLIYSEVKGYAGLDSEKLPKTIEKILNVKNILKNEDLGYENIECRYFHFSTWDEESASKLHKSTYDKMEKNGIKIMFMSDYFKEHGVDITKEEFLDIFRHCGKIIKG